MEICLQFVTPIHATWWDACSTLFSLSFSCIVWPWSPFFCSPLLSRLIFEWTLTGPCLFSFLTSVSSVPVGTVFGNGKTSDYLLLGNFVYTVSRDICLFCMEKGVLPYVLVLFSHLHACISGFKGWWHFPLRMKWDVLISKRWFHVKLLKCRLGSLTLQYFGCCYFQYSLFTLIPPSFALVLFLNPFSSVLFHVLVNIFAFAILGCLSSNFSRISW